MTKDALSPSPLDHLELVSKTRSTDKGDRTSCLSAPQCLAIYLLATMRVRSKRCDGIHCRITTGHVNQIMMANEKVLLHLLHHLLCYLEIYSFISLLTFSPSSFVPTPRTELWKSTPLLIPFTQVPLLGAIMQVTCNLYSIPNGIMTLKILRRTTFYFTLNGS